MAWLTRIGVLLACSTGVATVSAQEPPARPEAKAKPKVEFRWLESGPAKGLTEEKGVRTTCGPGLAYPHLKPVLTVKDVAGTRITSFVINGFGGPRESFTVHFQLTKEARKALVEACGGERRKELDVFVDGKYVSTR